MGIRFSAVTGVFSGAPTSVRAQTVYTVTANGPGGTATTTVIITVVPNTASIKGTGSRAAAFTARSQGNGYVFRLVDQASQASGVRVSICDLQGRTLWSREAKGSDALVWNGTVANGQRAGHGIYLVRLELLDGAGKVSASFQKSVSYRP
jgi:hypothetical protein